MLVLRWQRSIYSSPREVIGEEQHILSLYEILDDSILWAAVQDLHGTVLRSTREGK